jgi:gas vesicle protein
MIMEATGNRSGNFLIGLLVGGLVGAVAGILLAPKPGKELRGDIKEKADEARAFLEKTVERAKELKKEADRQLSEARLRFKHIFEGVEEKKGRTPRYAESEIEGEA